MKNGAEKIKVLIFEDNRHLRESLHLLVSSSAQFECIGAYPDTRNVIIFVSKLMPDVILMDIEMPGMNGIDATRLIKQKFRIYLFLFLLCLMTSHT